MLDTVPGCPRADASSSRCAAVAKPCEAGSGDGLGLSSPVNVGLGRTGVRLGRADQGPRGWDDLACLVRNDGTAGGRRTRGKSRTRVRMRLEIARRSEEVSVAQSGGPVAMRG